MLAVPGLSEAVSSCPETLPAHPISESRMTLDERLLFAKDFIPGETTPSGGDRDGGDPQGHVERTSKTRLLQPVAAP